MILAHISDLHIGQDRGDGGGRVLADVVQAHDNVAAVLCGHVHTGATTMFAGRPLVVAPGVVSTVVLPFESTTVVDYDLPPAVAFHLFGEGEPVTHFRSV